jgi:DNA-directed RNA polymerase subunit H
LQLHDKIKLNKNALTVAKMPSSQINHILQPKHTILKTKEVDELLKDFNISLTQLPKIKVTDPALPQGANIGDIVKIERKDEDGKATPYYRVIVI